MQWRCPHCGIVLAVPQNALVSGWSFSRCYKCAGFALVRKSEISVVKLDSAPPGEQVILPEASSDLSIAALGREALQKLSQTTQQSSLKQPIQFSPQSKPQLTNLNGELAKGFPENLSHPESSHLSNSSSGTAFGDFLPKPLPELPIPTSFARTFFRNYIGTLPVILVVIMSGTALFFQSQSFLKSVRPSTTLDIEAAAYHPNADIVGKRDSANSVQLPSHKQSQPSAPEQSIFDRRTHDPMNYDQKIMISDQITEKAMAPLPALPIPPASIVATGVATGAATGEKAAEKQLEETKEKLEQSTPIKPLLSLAIKTKNAKIRLGPGIDFPVIAIANSAEFYDVVDWNSRWFKVVIPHAKGIHGWIRNDLVQVKENNQIPQVH